MPRPRRCFRAGARSAERARMTERADSRHRSAASGRPRPLPTVLAALAVFAVAFEFLAFQLSAGKDPALGTGVATTAPVSKTRPAKKLIITKVIPAAGGAGVGGGTSYSTSGQSALP